MPTKKYLKISRYTLAYLCGIILFLSHLFFWGLLAIGLGTERVSSVLILPLVIYFCAGCYVWCILVDKILGEKQ